MNIIPLFKSHYSLKSILTLEAAGDTAKLATENKRKPELAPDSIIDLCLTHEIKDLFLVEDGMNAFLEAYMNAKKAGLDLHFGYRVTLTNNLADKSDESRKTDSKIVVFARNTAGYKRLIKISTMASTLGFYYEPRIDGASLKAEWDEEDLLLAIPFYDSFIYYNTLTFRSIVPQLPGKPTFFIEDNDLPFDESIKAGIEKFDPSQEFDRVKAKSIYYAKTEDITAFQTYRCIRNRSTLAKPQLDHFASDQFSLEAYLAQESKWKTS